jgi:uncharacterized membrane protein
LGVLRRRLDILAPVEHVFALVHDHPEQAMPGGEGVRLERLSKGPMKRGSRLRYVIELPGGREFTCDVEHTDVVRNRLAAWNFVSGISGHGSYRYEEIWDGGTRMFFEMEFKLPGGVLGNLAAPMIQRRMEEALDRALNGIKRRLENEASHE